MLLVCKSHPMLQLPLSSGLRNCRTIKLISSYLITLNIHFNTTFIAWLILVELHHLSPWFLYMFLYRGDTHRDPQGFQGCIRPCVRLRNFCAQNSRRQGSGFGLGLPNHRLRPWDTMGYHGIPWDTRGYQGYQGIPGDTMGFNPMNATLQWDQNGSKWIKSGWWLSHVEPC